MPIYGLTDRGLSFPEIGQIRKGDKGGKNGAPRDLDHFRVVFDDKETERAAIFHSIYGDNPTQLSVMLPFNELDRCWDCWYEAYTAGRMVARSDGRYFTFRVDHQTGEILVVNGLDQRGQQMPHQEQVGIYMDGNGKSQPIKMKPVGRLKVVIPELRSLAYLTVHTTSIHDIVNISAQLAAIRTITGGQIAGIPLVLCRKPKAISTPAANGARARRIKWMLSIEASPAWVEAKLNALNAAAFAPLLPVTTEQALALPPGDELPDPDDEETGDEPTPIPHLPEPEIITLTTPPPAETEPAPDGPRPWAPERVRQMIDDYMIQYKAHKITEGKRKLIAPMLEACFTTNQTERRHAVQHYLTGFSSLKDMGDSMLIGLYLWLSPSTDTGAWLPCKEAVAEANRILETVPDGQDELPF